MKNPKLQGASPKRKRRLGVQRHCSATCSFHHKSPAKTLPLAVTAEPGREVAWESRSFGLKIALWRYRFVPNQRGGTTVIESTEDRRGTVMNIVGPLVTGVRDRSGDNTKNMRATLEQLKAAAERSVS